jgi:hypothetical protein
MFRLDAKQAVLDHVAAQSAARNGPTVLGDAARRIVAAPVEPTYSGTVIVGIAQAIEALLLATLGFAIHSSYVSIDGGLYISIIIGAVVAANVLFNATQTHRIAAYRTVDDATGARARRLVGGLHARRRGRVPVQGVRLRVARLARHLVRERRGAARRLPPVAARHRPAVDARGQAQAPHGDRRRRPGCRGTDQRHPQGRRERHPLFGLFDDRGDDRSPESVAGLPKLGKVADLIEFARQTRVDL